MNYDFLFIPVRPGAPHHEGHTPQIIRAAERLIKMIEEGNEYHLCKLIEDIRPSVGTAYILRHIHHTLHVHGAKICDLNWLIADKKDYRTARITFLKQLSHYAAIHTTANFVEHGKPIEFWDWQRRSGNR